MNNPGDKADPSDGPADPERRKRANARVLWSLYVIGVGFVLVVFCGDWQVNRIPAPWFGWSLIGIGVLGLLGFNVFSGGPLDKQLDHEPAPPGRSENNPSPNQEGSHAANGS